MILHSGVGFAMKNAIPEIKNSTKHVTRYSNEEDGVALALVENRVVIF